MATFDWIVVGTLTLIPAIYGLLFTGRASSGGEEGFFTASRRLPWWAIGISNTATYHGGMAPFVMLYFTLGLTMNWLWWPQWVIWMPLVAVIWAKLWQRLKVVTTAELISLRYSGTPAKLARSVYAFSMFVFSVILTGYATGFFAKTLVPIIPLNEWQILLFIGVPTVIYTMFGGLLGSVMASVIQSAIFLGGAFIVLIVLIPQFGGWGTIIDKIASHRPEAISPNPFAGKLDVWTFMMFIFLGFFFPGSPVAGEGWTAQRFMAAKNEKHAIGGQLFNAFIALALRIIPILGIGIIAMSVFWMSDFGKIPEGFEKIEDPTHVWGMLLLKSKLPFGLLGLIVATEIAAFISSLSAFINWGSSFIVNDLYKQIKSTTSEKQQVLASRTTSLLMFVLSSTVALLWVENMVSWFVFINSVVVIFWLPLTYFRFFWPRFNAWGDLSSTLLGVPVSILIWFVFDFQSKPYWQALGLIFGLAIFIIVTVTLLTPPEPKEKLLAFYKRCRPMAGWKKFRKIYAFTSDNNTPLSSLITNSIIGIIACIAMVLAVQGLFSQRWYIVIVYMILAVLFSTWMVRRCTKITILNKDRE